MASDHESRPLQRLEVHVEQRTADAELTRQFADVALRLSSIDTTRWPRFPKLSGMSKAGYAQGKVVITV